jgi:hypothetical protein
MEFVIKQRSSLLVRKDILTTTQLIHKLTVNLQSQINFYVSEFK